ncbi:DUF1289 domain-containing protein [Maliponia aquimaris]|uniref:Fe-S protein n=1 Tax=Maliponia aquimaris TaxID=1673631 RepID=A0A238K2W8_9RHOB|nr:DUF1289 domain-containing protein [Maliponia aquimaris]SMX36807.1 hypothetical protein MAA8898_01054 [Maliponia aquimaris]
MKDEIWRRDEVESPCVKVCVIHPQERLCTGCLRTAREITLWASMSAEERREVLDDLPGRAGRMRKRRGGREARLKRQD